MLGIQPKFQTCEKQKNREKKTPKEKQSHTQDSIYVVRQFAYVHRVAEIHYYKRKLQCAVTVFFFLKNNKKTKP